MSLENLAQVLNTLSKEPDALDHKLADYVFFPISQVLKASRELPVRAMELCLQCLAVLISRGWRENITTSLSSQLLIFLSLMCDTSGKTVAVQQVTDELRHSAFLCMSKLFDSLSLSDQGKASLMEAANVPSLGHAVSVLLDGVSAGESFEVQKAAADAILSLLLCTADVEVLSSFFPGVVSTLTKVLTPNTQSRRHWKILVQCISILDSFVLALLSNSVMDEILKPDIQEPRSEQQKNALDESWAKATASQFKVALANIERLRTHSREEVREALTTFNMTLLADCNIALGNCCRLALETVLVLLQQESVFTITERARLEVLVRSRPAIAELLASVYHDELLSLTRILQSNDDNAKGRCVKQVFSAYSMLAGTDSDMHLLSRLLGIGLRDSVTAMLQSSNDTSNKSLQENTLVLSEMPVLNISKDPVSFSMPLSEYRNQQTLLKDIEVQLQTIKQTIPAASIAAHLVPALKACQGEMQIATFWLVLCDIQASALTEDMLNDFLILEDSSDSPNSRAREELYSFSLDIMDDNEADWRLKALALETVAMQAKQQGESFRGELIDALYPILHHLGSESPQVRNHAITCLNLVSDACNYSDVKELIVSNVDYLVNAVALKLNAFDVSPQGPQVLLMMVRLAGPSLLPYLEDTLESIFAALEDYHGYPTLVELLFAVLKTMAEEGVKSPQLAILPGENDTSFEVTVNGWSPASIQDLSTDLRKLAVKAAETSDVSLPESTPQIPWKELRPEGTTTGQQDTQKAEDETEEEDTSNDSQPPPEPPAPRTYALLLKITTLTQHYLTSTSPSLRTSLLSLIRTTMPALARHQNSFLPLINTLWPEVTSRLFDSEPHVVAGALGIIAAMCEFGGEFMRSRIHDLWPEVMNLHRRIGRGTGSDASSERGRGLKYGQQSIGKGKEIATGVSGTGTPPPSSLALGHATVGRGGGGYVDVSDRAVNQALHHLIKAIVKHVGIDAESFDQVLEILRPLNKLDEDIRSVLEGYNADAVWLAGYREGSCRVERMEVAGSGAWRFVSLGC